MYFHRELISFGMTDWVKGSLVWTEESCGWVIMAGVELVRRQGRSERLQWCCCHLLETEDSGLLPEGARDRLRRGLGDWGQAPDRLLTGSGPSLRLPLLVLQVLLPGV